MRNTTPILRDGATAPPQDEDIVLRLTGSGRPPRSEVGSLDDISEPNITLSLPALQLRLISAAMKFCKARRGSSWSAVKSILSLSSSFRDAPLGAGPESILPAGVMDSGLARFARAPE